MPQAYGRKEGRMSLSQARHGDARTVTSDELFGEADSLLIHHAGAWYLLRRLRRGGLLLTRWTGEPPPPAQEAGRLRAPPAAENKPHRRGGLFGRVWLGD
jgi:hemin uptake protein HemP